MELISLASGASYFHTPSVASQVAIKGIQEHKTFYGSPEGTLALRQAIVNRYKQVNNASVNLGQVIVTPGTKQALYNILQAILQPGDEVIVPIPNWGGLYQVLQHLKAKIVLLPTSPEDGYTINPEALASLITANTKLFLFTNPNNPSGRIYNKTEISQWLEVLDNHPEVYVLSDEVYDLVTFEKSIPSLYEFEDKFNRFLVVNGFSKSFAMTGWRLGYLICPLELSQKCIEFQHIIYGNVPEFIQDAGVAILENISAVQAPIFTALKENKQQMELFLVDQHIPYFKSEAAYYYFPDLSGYLNDVVPDSYQLADYLKRNYKVEILPGDLFGAPGFARLSFAIQKNKLIEALKRLQEAFTQIKNLS
ncbi:pyridoxal phosphate-dependent aminotransferase [Adhaeribacter aquaticus]|uniref:pyridoxal phosphate-dependent aminotransferase n=1 Tax=Adhaeribacter aquaticus TaxID=299567 RepID=UPI0003FDB64A|nr:aminotransferase class I/II-fold pyridoxal phosphate-dependent enzyme [Adhaeribacter aquaticus]